MDRIFLIHPEEPWFVVMASSVEDLANQLGGKLVKVYQGDPPDDIDLKSPLSSGFIRFEEGLFTGPPNVKIKSEFEGKGPTYQMGPMLVSINDTGEHEEDHWDIDFAEVPFWRKS
jgi:hypothetical protein